MALASGVIWPPRRPGPLAVKRRGFASRLAHDSRSRTEETATADTLPMGAGIYHQHPADSWVRIFAVGGIKPALHDRDSSAFVSQRAATLIAEQPQPRKLAGQW
jgi:hypothetical protein